MRLNLTHVNGAELKYQRQPIEMWHFLGGGDNSTFFQKLDNPFRLMISSTGLQGAVGASLNNEDLLCSANISFLYYNFTT